MTKRATRSIPFHSLRRLAPRAAIFGVTANMMLMAAVQPGKTVVRPKLAVAAARPGIYISRALLHGSGAGMTVRLRFQGSRPQIHDFFLPNPPRWVLDIHSAVKARGIEQIQSQNPWFQQLRMAQFQPSVVRMVLDLRSPRVHPVWQVSDHIIKVDFPVSGFHARPATLQPPVLPPSEPVSLLDRARAHARFAPHPPQPSLVSSVNLPPPAGLRARPAPWPALAPHTAAVSAPPSVPPQPAPENALAAGPPETPASLIDFCRQMSQPATNFSGERISLHLKNASMADFFRIIHKIDPGLNVYVDPNTQGLVTMDADNIPWDQALEMVMRSHVLGCEFQGNLLRIAQLKTLIAEQNERRDYELAHASQSPVEVVLWHLKYRSAKNITQFLCGTGGSGSKISSQTRLNAQKQVSTVETSTGACTNDVELMGMRGRLIPYHPTVAMPQVIPGESVQMQTQRKPATLMIIAARDRIPKIEAVINQLDRHRPQVQITARIVQTSRSFARQLGAQIGFLTNNRTTTVGGVPSLGSSPIGQGIPLNQNLPAVATSGISILNATANYEIDAILTASENRGLTHIISAPEVITQDNEAASIFQGVQFALQTSNGLSGATNTMQNATLQLEVVPRIAPNGKILMSVVVLNQSIDSGLSFVGEPAVDVQGATAHVLIRNGSTLLIGGVMVHNRQTNTAQVPLLGYMPVVGNLFKQTQVTKSNQELLFFITPKILQ